jgi:uncharacterized membrane protein
MMTLLISFPILAQLSLEPIFGWLGLGTMAVVLLASLWLTLTSPGLSWRARGLLSLLRLLAMLVLLLGWLRPALIANRERESAGAVAVLIDRSQSMVLPSDVSDRTRWEMEREVWGAIESATQLKIGQTSVVPYVYDQDLSAVASDALPGLDKVFEQPASGRSTDLGGALAKIGRLQLDPPLRGVIVLGDGVQTLLPAPTDAIVAARQMAQLDQPILFVGIGPRGEQGQIKDIALEGMPDQLTAFVKKELTVPIVVHAQGMQNVPVDIELTLRASGKPTRTVGKREVLASQPNEKLALEFTVVVPDAGEYLLEANATVNAREQNKSNNQLLSFVTVRDGGVRILYLAGQPLPEQKFLRRSLEESRDFATEYQLWPERERRKWPLELSGDLQQFDVLIIDDLAAAALSENASREIVSRVRRGAGILFMGGYRSYDAGGYARSPLAPLFPFEISPKPYVWGSPVDPALHVLDKVAVRPTLPHPITTLASEPDNSRIWRQLKPLKGINRFGTLRRDPGVLVLLEGAQREPVLVTGEFGQGRVLAFAGDSTWQWHLAGQTKVHQQFWRQALLWLVRRDTLNEGFRLELDRRRYLLDEQPQLFLEWFGGSENKAMPADLKLEVSREGAWLQNLSSTLATENSRKATIVGLDKAGLYRVALTAQGANGEAYQTEAAFIVRDESRELAQSAADWRMINNIVSANRAAGGKLILPEEIGSAIEWLRQRQESTKVVTVEKRRLGDGVWDAWLYLVVFSLLMSIEWGLRKSWQLP